MARKEDQPSQPFSQPRTSTWMAAHDTVKATMTGEGGACGADWGAYFPGVHGDWWGC